MRCDIVTSSHGQHPTWFPQERPASMSSTKWTRKTSLRFFLVISMIVILAGYSFNMHYYLSTANLNFYQIFKYDHKSEGSEKMRCNCNFSSP